MSLKYHLEEENGVSKGLSLSILSVGMPETNVASEGRKENERAEGHASAARRMAAALGRLISWLRGVAL